MRGDSIEMTHGLLRFAVSTRSGRGNHGTPILNPSPRRAYYEGDSIEIPLRLIPCLIAVHAVCQFAVLTRSGCGGRGTPTLNPSRGAPSTVSAL